MKCRICNNELTHQFVDLGFSPPSNSFLKKENLNEPESFYPLRILVCEKCYLVQIDEFAKHSDIFGDDYVYFSSYSKSWLKHAKAYTNLMTEKLNLSKDSLVIEIASNDGYLLQYFKEKNIPVLGVEPTANTAAVAISKGIDTIIDFFGIRIAESIKQSGKKPDLILGNNVLAHVPDINDFVGGVKILLKDSGVVTFEFPHLLQLVLKTQFDTIYHEHFSYLSLLTVQKLLELNGLKIFDVQEIPTHGGSLRIFAKHTENMSISVEESVNKLISIEIKSGISNLKTYESFQIEVERVKNDFLLFLINASQQKKRVVAYGAAAKGVTLLNYCGIRSDLISFVADASPHKIGKYLPGIHIPVLSESYIKALKPDYVVILPWNLRDEITEQLNYINEWGGKFVTAIPKLEVF